MSLDWKALRHVNLRVDEYEACRVRRKVDELIIPTEERMVILREWGYSRSEIRKLSRPVNLERARRKASRLRYHANNGQATRDMRNILKTILSLGCYGKKRRQEQLYIDDDSTTSTLASRVCQAQQAKERHDSSHRRIGFTEQSTNCMIRLETEEDLPLIADASRGSGTDVSSTGRA